MSTAFRISLIEQSYILLFLLPAVIIGFPIKLIFAVSLFLITYQLFCHNYYIRIPKILHNILITPDLHKTHHDQNYLKQNSNYGAVLSIWDRMFKTFNESDSTIHFGMKNYSEKDFLTNVKEWITSYLKLVNEHAN
jgi:sterol desaturase/sphingolipid hydroxylase (fatty acid hydroxylase superfamily)